MRKRPIVALVYDFDGTLSPGNMQEFGFIQAIGKKPQEFWQESDDIASGQDASNILSYMKHMFDEARKAGIKLRREDFKRFGAEIELYDGVLGWFSAVNKYGKERGVKVEHYINSSGLASMIEGTPIAKEFKRIFACSFIYNKEGEAEWPGVAVDYTAKTQFLFKINKGILSVRDNKKVNDKMNDRVITYQNMIYFGDGLTDIPCMTFVKKQGGTSIAVYQKGQKNKVTDLLLDDRVNYISPADYQEGSDLDTLVKCIIQQMQLSHSLLLKHSLRRC